MVLKQITETACVPVPLLSLCLTIINKNKSLIKVKCLCVCVCVCMQHTEEDLSVLVPSLQTGKIHKELNNSLLTG